MSFFISDAHAQAAAAPQTSMLSMLLWGAAPAAWAWASEMKKLMALRDPGCEKWPGIMPQGQPATAAR